LIAEISMQIASMQLPDIPDNTSGTSLRFDSEQ